ncbi:hypothetical protein [Flavobacterium cerinum]|uniref:AraC family transcriptional regulator n=1 Tax=Flavobacterium cerinum TaxID=2502784 RepID=A0ABY5IWX0_9FLAO|nr:hypothetical protein [Flavobacterium cerinum]UUC47323.1 hypothetical protein NOX80_09025 [Flavobacterium cerinum]
MINYIVYLGYLFSGINLLLYLKSYRREEKAFKIFTLYLLVIAIIQFFTSLLKNKGIHNLFLSHFYFILQMVFLSFFYLEILETKMQRRIVRSCLIGCLVVLGMQYLTDKEQFFRFNLFEIFITSYLIIIYSMFHFYNLLNKEKRYYYCNTGVLMYLFGSTVLFLSGNLINTLQLEFRNIVWLLNAWLVVIYQIFIFIEWRKRSLENKRNNE